MRSLARWLLPVIAVAVVLCLVMTGLLGQSRPGMGPQVRPAQAAAAWPGLVAPGRNAAGISARVGAVPGTRSPGQNRSSYAAPNRVPGTSVVAARPLSGPARPLSGPARAGHRLGRLHPADVLVVARASLPAGLLARIRGMKGVAAAVAVDAGRIKVDGVFVNVLGVNPARFRPFAAKPTARSPMLWQNVAVGGMAISFTMGRQDRLTLAKPVKVTGTRTLKLPVAGFGTVGIGGVDAVVSRTIAKSLGIPTANAIVVSAPAAHLDTLIARITRRAPSTASVAALVSQVIVGGAAFTTGAAGASGVTASHGPALTATQLGTFLAAATSRVGMPYVYGASGPTAFDCSGLVYWAMAQAGVLMPRVAADQARTGPLLRPSQLQPGDLLFYHTDPTAPNYISHVAIYIGNGLMLQAPQPGMNVEIVPADFGAGFAGAVRVYPKVAARVAASIAG